MRAMNVFVLLAALAGLAVCSSMARAQAGPSNTDLSNQSAEQLLDGIADKHPATYMMLAARLFQQGDKREAVKWLYVGQIRYRAWLKANPDLDPSGDPALFSALMSTVGQPLNEYIGGDVDEWVATIDDAIAWHQENPDGFLGKQEHQQIYASLIAGLEDMRDDIAARKDEIRQQREANGLENR